MHFTTIFPTCFRQRKPVACYELHGCLFRVIPVAGGRFFVHHYRVSMPFTGPIGTIWFVSASPYRPGLVRTMFMPRVLPPSFAG